LKKLHYDCTNLQTRVEAYAPDKSNQRGREGVYAPFMYVSEEIQNSVFLTLMKKALMGKICLIEVYF
jgi:hypothetical protein